MYEGKTLAKLRVGPSVEQRDGPPCIIVLHEVWGPDPNIDDACKRLRKLGFATAAPSLYEGYESVLSPRNVQKAMEAVWDLSLEDRRDKQKVAAEAAKKGSDGEARAALSVLYSQGFRDGMLEIVIKAVRRARAAHGKVATLGFSLGGGLSLASATRPGHPDAAVAYCGEPPGPHDLRGVSIPMLAIYASRDEIINPLVPAFVEAALKHGLDLTAQVLPDTRHDFFNMTKRGRYNREAAEKAWETTAWFLTRTLGWDPHPSYRQ